MSWQTIDRVYHLIKAGADPNATDSKGNTVLNFVANERKAELLKKFVDAGCDYNNKKKYDDFTIIDVAISYHSPEMVKYLLSIGAEFNDTVRRRGRLCKRIHNIFVHSFTTDEELMDLKEIIHLLIEAGADLLEKDSDGRTPLECLKCYCNSYTLIKFMEKETELFKQKKRKQLENRKDDVLHKQIEILTQQKDKLLEENQNLKDENQNLLEQKMVYEKTIKQLVDIFPKLFIESNVEEEQDRDNIDVVNEKKLMEKDEMVTELSKSSGYYYYFY